MGHVGFYGLGGIWMIIVWVLIIVAGIYVLRIFVRDKDNRHQQSETPDEILKRRYASGDISNREYEEMKEKLHHG
jgi:putative membrane protein